MKKLDDVIMFYWNRAKMLWVRWRKSNDFRWMNRYGNLLDRSYNYFLINPTPKNLRRMERYNDWLLRISIKKWGI